MILHYGRLGSGPPLIILHGLYGSGDNWLSVARGLSDEHEVFLVDQRNHGRSFHSEVHDYPSMADDLTRLMDHLELSRATLLGHSMGGKTAMRFAVSNPSRVSGLIIADISPRTYNSPTTDRQQQDFHYQVLKILSGIRLKDVRLFGEADRLLAPALPDKRLRQFILKNLGRSPDGHLAWKLNLPALLSNLNALMSGMEDVVLAGITLTGFPVLFIRGDQSPYIRDEDVRMIRVLFPLAQVTTLKNAGHWLHAEQPARFIAVVKQFLTRYSDVP